jgi:hypothetical protein
MAKLNVEIDGPDVATFWEMLEASVSDMASSVDGSTLHLPKVGHDKSAEDSVLKYARFLTLYRKLRKGKP